MTCTSKQKGLKKEAGLVFGIFTFWVGSFRTYKSDFVVDRLKAKA